MLASVGAVLEARAVLMATLPFLVVQFPIVARGARHATMCQLRLRDTARRAANQPRSNVGGGAGHTTPPQRQQRARGTESGGRGWAVGPGSGKFATHMMHRAANTFAQETERKAADGLHAVLLADHARAEHLPPPSQQQAVQQQPPRKAGVSGGARSRVVAAQCVVWIRVYVPRRKSVRCTRRTSGTESRGTCDRQYCTTL